MAKQFSEINDQHRKFIARQRIFFVASAAPGSHVNVSPRSTDCFRLLGGNAVAYLDRTGSGNETAAHVRAGGRVTIMFCSFAGPPLILRLYGEASVLRRGQAEFHRLLEQHFDGNAPLGTRQIVRLDAELIQTSCGYGVPLFDHRGERDALEQWASSKGEEGLQAYRREHNARSLDGLPTGVLEEATEP
jgi:hypothetical protein